MKLWKLLTTDLKNLNWLLSLDTVDNAANLAADTAEALTNLNDLLEEQAIQDIDPLVAKSASLLDILDRPEVELAESIIPFAKIATGLLKFYIEKTKKTPKLSQCVLLTSLTAYSKSLAFFLEKQKDGRCRQPVRKQADITQKNLNTSDLFEEAKQFELTEIDAKTTLLQFHDSELAIHLGTLIISRLQARGFTKEEAKIMAKRTEWHTHRYLLETWGDLPDEIQQKIGQSSFGEWQKEQVKYTSIDTYLKEYVSSDPTDLIRKQHWQVFDESFNLKAIYVQLQGQLLDCNGEDKPLAPLELETWAKASLKNRDNNQVLFIQAGPGRGKSVFCRLFADWIQEHIHPIWTPIFIRLRDIPKIQNSLQETLREAVPGDFAKSDDGWLTDRNTRFLFFLDGFDELLMEGRTSGGLESFLRQVGQFQQSCTNPEMGHRIIITGRPLALQGVERTLPHNFERIKILPMREKERQQWFTKWQTLIRSNKAENFCIFLKAQECPKWLKGSIHEIGLAQEPLLLYLLAAMHRDGELDLETFTKTNSRQAKVLIYQKALEWVLTKQRPKWLNRNLTELETDGLRRILAEAGLCVMQSEGECASIKMIEDRLRTDEQARDLLDEAQSYLKDNPLRNALAAFYLQTGRKGTGSVEFVHKSFSEFLCAERIKQAIEDWTYPGRRNQFETSDEQLYWQIYDVFATPVLTQEVIEYLMVLLHKSNAFKPRELFQRLYRFYCQWCEHEFINRAPSENYPQTKWLRLQTLDISSGLQEIDIYAGLNVLILLFKLHEADQHDSTTENDSVSKINFHPCDKYNKHTWKQSRLLELINYAEMISLKRFTTFVGPHLSRANLSNVNLDNANLASANLSNANLDNANLKNANLDNTNLSNANLDNANLSNANLDNANLKNANLDNANLDRATSTRTNFSGASLSRASLNNTNLDRANLSSTNLNNAYLNNASLNNANLSNANLDNAYLNNANLDNANLKNAHLSSTFLDNASLGGTNLSRAFLDNASLDSARLVSANLDGTNLSRAFLVRANLNSARLVSANLKNASLIRADLENANLAGTNLEGANLDSANLKHISFNKKTNWNKVKNLETTQENSEEL